MINRFKHFFLGLFFLNIIFIPIFDILTHFSDKFGVFGVINWYITYFFIFLAVIFAIKDILKISLSHRTFIGLSMLFYFLIMIFVNIPRPENVGGETTNEMSCTLNLLETIDKGYLKTCVYGYPSRQLYLPAVPSLIFGRTPFTLNSGISIYVFFGLILFTAGLIKKYNFDFRVDIFIALTLAFLMHFYFFNHFAFYYEQSIIPLSFGLMTIGLWLLYKKDHSWFYLGTLGVMLFYLIYSYTPGLSFYFLCLGVGSVLLFKKNISFYQRAAISIILVTSFVSCIISFKHRMDANVYVPGRTIQERVIDFTQGAKHLFLQSEARPVVNSSVAGVFLFIVAGSIMGIFGRRYFFLGLWIAGVIFASLLSKGYNYYEADFRLHRTIVIVPVFLFMFFSLLYQHRETRILNSKKFLLALLIYVFCTGFFFQQSFLFDRRAFKMDTLEDARHVNFIEWFKKSNEIKDFRSKNNIFFDMHVQDEYLSLNDRLHYFLPETQSYILDEDCSVKDVRFGTQTYYILTDNSTCTDGSLTYISTFAFNNEQNVNLYKLSE